ncbi:hypothetical protein C0053_08815 [Pseudomonas aeruginosa]|nr:hypothetical protein CW299_43285 [Pseudomonas aeruginosa]PXB82421.1 hypothetical protein C0044_41700 [Pseudomonas aeruginosa]PXZ60381.1 hypothetical protein C0055_06775 [Pseudomonas aeruginosa]PXZ65918.1 hypothetical protein C0057_09225 [Pseudomonas aeruginosa]PXZ71339.1 hypothetical protein C0051_08880 [Pseudomonas aeruginosa]
MVAIAEALDPRAERAGLRTGPITAGLQRLLAAILEDGNGALPGRHGGVRVARRQAAGVVAIAEAAPVLIGGGLADPIDHFVLVAGAEIPVIVAANRKAERPGGQFRAGFGHGLGVGEAVHEAIGVRDQQAILTPVDRSVEAQRFGRADKGEALALNLVLAHVEAALERGAYCARERVFVVCVHCFSSVVASGCVVCWTVSGRPLV